MWKTIATRDVYSARTPDEISVRIDVVELPDGHRFEYVYAHSPYQVVVVVGILEGEEDRVILLRQFRYLARKHLTEVPAGSPDTVESLEEAARREFEEEAGYRPGKLERIGSFYPSVGVTDQVSHVFVAWQLDRTQQTLERAESIEAMTVPLSLAEDMVHGGDIANGAAALALLMATRWWTRRGTRDR